MKRWALLILLILAVPIFGQYGTMPVPLIQFSDVNGNPLSGGIVCTYAAGTTTPLATFTSYTGGTPNATCATPGVGGIVLNAGGFPASGGIFLLAGTAYKIVLYNSLGVLQWSQDGISIPTPAGGNQDVQFNMAGVMGYDPLFYYDYTNHVLHVATIGSSSVPPTAYAVIYDCGGQVYNVICWNADPTGSNDSTAAIQAAATAAGSKGICFPPGTYLYSTTITMASEAPIGSCGLPGDSGPEVSPSVGAPITVLNWTSAGAGPGFVETNTHTSSHLVAQTHIGGFSMKNTGGNSSFVFIQINNGYGPYFDHLAAGEGTNGTCIQLVQSDGNGTERTVIGPGVNLSCTKDVDFLNSGGGSGSFAYTRFLDPNLDTNSVVFETGSKCFGCSLTWHANAGGGTIITTAGAGAGILNSAINVYGEGTSCQIYNLAASSMVDAQGTVRMNGCSTSSVLGSGAWWAIEGQMRPTDSAAAANNAGAYPSATYTTYFGTADRTDLAAPIDWLGMYSVPASPYGGVYWWHGDNGHLNQDCLTGLQGASTLAASTVAISLCLDGLAHLGTAGLTLATLNAAPYSSAPFGSITFCSDCKNVQDDSVAAGATCVSGGTHGALAKVDNTAHRWDCN